MRRNPRIHIYRRLAEQFRLPAHLDLCFLFATAAASTHAPPISGSDEYRMVGFSERAIDNDGFPALDDFTLLVRSEKN